jgi:hypothetical protein
MTWLLVLLLNFGTPQQSREVLAHGLPSWNVCIERAVQVLRHRSTLNGRVIEPAQPVAVRCEPSGLDGETRRAAA